MARSPASKRWLQEHGDDPWVQRCRQQGYRSRASYKLQEIHRRDRLIRPGMTVVDLGAAPGGWSQVAAELTGKRGRVVAIDRLPMVGLPGVEFIQGDLADQRTGQQLRTAIGDSGADLVISDMAPNISGISAIDQPRVMQLAELTLDLAQSILRPQAYLLIKLFHGAGFNEFRQQLQARFKAVKSRKPQASRSRSAEIYLLAAGYRADFQA